MRFLEKDVVDWMGDSVWRVGRTVEYRLMYRRSIKAETDERKRECPPTCQVFCDSWPQRISRAVTLAASRTRHTDRSISSTTTNKRHQSHY